MAKEEPLLILKDVNKIYKGGNAAISNINLTINKGDFICLTET